VLNVKIKSIGREGRRLRKRHPKIVSFSFPNPDFSANINKFLQLRK